MAIEPGGQEKSSVTRTEELVVMLLVRVAKLEARLDAFTALSLRLQLGKDCKQHPLCDSFTKLEVDLLGSYIRTFHRAVSRPWKADRGSRPHCT